MFKLPVREFVYPFEFDQPGTTKEKWQAIKEILPLFFWILLNFIRLLVFRLLQITLIYLVYGNNGIILALAVVAWIVSWFACMGYLGGFILMVGSLFATYSLYGPIYAIGLLVAILIMVVLEWRLELSMRILRTGLIFQTGNVVLGTEGVLRFMQQTGYNMSLLSQILTELAEDEEKSASPETSVRESSSDL